MQKIVILSLILLSFSCSSNKKDDPLVIPPAFNEVPDPNKPETPNPKSVDKNVQRLKDLLLKSE